MQSGLWFKRKKYGWGWTPANWAGWTVLLLYIAGCVAYPLYTEQERMGFSFPLFLAIIVALTAGLIGLCFLKGEKPHWQWGDEK